MKYDQVLIDEWDVMPKRWKNQYWFRHKTDSRIDYSFSYQIDPGIWFAWDYSTCKWIHVERKSIPDTLKIKLNLVIKKQDVLPSNNSRMT